MTTVEILRAAKGRLTPLTWTKGTINQIPGYRECANMAIRGASGLTEEWGWSFQALAVSRLLAAVVTGSDLGSVSLWNDAPERTLQDVYDAFDAAIAIAEQQERDSARQQDYEQPTPINAVRGSVTAPLVPTRA